MSKRSKRLTVVEELVVDGASKANVKDAIARRGGASAVTVRRNDGKVIAKDSVKAQAALSDEQALGKVIASKIIAHLDGGERGIYGEMMRLDKATLDAKKAAWGEIVAKESDRIADTERAYPGDENESFRARKINSIRSSFSRLITVVKAMCSTVHTYDFSKAESFSDMVAAAREFSKGLDKNKKTMTASGFSTWVKKADRIVDLKKYDEENETSIEQVARLEQFIVKAIAAYAKVGNKIGNLRFDVKALQACIGIKEQARKHLKAA